jgi:hypothetical protein
MNRRPGNEKAAAGLSQRRLRYLREPSLLRPGQDSPPRLIKTYDLSNPVLIGKLRARATSSGRSVARCTRSASFQHRHRTACIGKLGDLRRPRAEHPGDDDPGLLRQWLHGRPFCAEQSHLPPLSSCGMIRRGPGHHGHLVEMGLKAMGK